MRPFSSIKIATNTLFVFLERQVLVCPKLSYILLEHSFFIAFQYAAFLGIPGEFLKSEIYKNTPLDL